MTATAPTTAAPTAAASDAKPIFDDMPKLRSYYDSFESRAGYRIVLGGARHFGYWEKDTKFAIPTVGPALRRMEDKVGEALRLPPGSRVLDAGCGAGIVAMRMATKFGFNVFGLDFTPHHVDLATKRAAKARAKGLFPEGAGIEVRHMDYHHLETLATDSFDGVYTVETLVHATDLGKVLAGFRRILKPGGRIVMHEYDSEYLKGMEDGIEEMGGKPAELARDFRTINDLGAMPTMSVAKPGYYKEKLEEAGFVDVQVKDYTANILPMLRLFWQFAIIPYFILKMLGLQDRFVNTLGAYDGYRGYGAWRYKAITASVPLESVEPVESTEPQKVA